MPYSYLSQAASQAVRDRVRNKALHKLIRTPDQLLPFFQDGMSIGFPSLLFPRKMPTVLADHVEKNNLQGKLKFDLFWGASMGEMEDRWAKLDMIRRRSCFQTGSAIQKSINADNVKFFDSHLSHFPRDLDYGFLTKEPGSSPSKKIDIGVIDGTAILPDGTLVMGTSCGCPEVVRNSEKLIIELNTELPDLTGLHDIYLQELPPFREPIPLRRVGDKIGTPGIPIPWDRVIGIVEARGLDCAGAGGGEPSDTANAIAGHILEFLHDEIKFGRQPANLLPLQSGIGEVANAVIGGLNKSDLTDLWVWTEVAQDTFLDLFDSEKLKFLSTTSLRLSKHGFEHFFENLDFYMGKVLLRPQSVSNNPEVIRRLGVIGMNTPLEVDIYGHANSTCVAGSRMMHGIGGSGDFLRNSKLSIMHTPSARPTKTDPTGISCIVPMCTHVDHTEHDINIIVTEQGLADLRGLSPKERAVTVIDKCAHPDFKPILKDYFNMAYKECLRKKTTHEPHMLMKAFKMYDNLEKNGTMKVTNWD